MKFIILLMFPLLLFSAEPSNNKVKALYNSLDPHSVAEHLAFYDLYSQYPEGRKALVDACQLLSNGNESFSQDINNLPSIISAIDAIVSLVNKQPDLDSIVLKENELAAIEKLAEWLPNRTLKGYWARSEDEVLVLPTDEIDLTRGILLTQMENEPNAFSKIRSYEAMIDLMALQILARIPLTSDPETKIAAINHFIFYEMGFRFPPHSIHAKDIDLYTFLPSVLDSRKGVCLGVSILYMCLAQRLDLNLEMITPPGHIYVRYRDGNKIINIETTARGIDLDSEEYLGIDTCALQQRSIKDVIGLAHFNQASVYWETKQYQKALTSYNKAEKYLPNDELLIELLGYTNLLNGNIEEGEKLLKKIVNHDPEFTVVRETVAEDYLKGLVGIDGIEAIFARIDETRESIIEKRQTLEKIAEKYPQFRGALFSLAGAWLQLHREGEALEILKRYHAVDPNNPSIEYFMSAIYASRFDYNKAWEHLQQTEKILYSKNHHPQALQELRKELAARCPE